MYTVTFSTNSFKFNLDEYKFIHINDLLHVEISYMVYSKRYRYKNVGYILNHALNYTNDTEYT